MGRNKKYSTPGQYREANKKNTLERYYKLKGKDVETVMKELEKLENLLKYYKEAYPEDEYGIKEQVKKLNLVF
jgi:hypothetical protein